jgi:hypothetical protein
MTAPFPQNEQSKKSTCLWGRSTYDKSQKESSGGNREDGNANVVEAPPRDKPETGQQASIGDKERRAENVARIVPHGRVDRGDDR